MKKLLTAAALLVATSGLASGASAATTYNFADFDNPVFSYGFGVTGYTFTTYNQRFENCLGATGLTCASYDASGFPLIGVNTTGSTLNFQTVALPTNTLYFHPANGACCGDAILAFTAPTAGDYKFTGTFSRIDTVPSGGNGVIAIEAATGNYGGGATPIFSTVIPNGAYGSGFSFSNRLKLNAGQAVFFGVNNNGGEYTYDSTGLVGSIAAVPEPATWAMMIGGFGVIGGGMRARRRNTKVAFATA